MSMFCTLQDFYLPLLLEQVLEQKHLCGWSTSGVLLEPVLRLGSPRRNPGTALQRAPKQGLEESLGQTASKPCSPFCLKYSGSCAPSCPSAALPGFGDEAKLNFFLFYGSLESQDGNIFSSSFTSLAPQCKQGGPGVFPPVSDFGIKQMVSRRIQQGELTSDALQKNFAYF